MTLTMEEATKLADEAKERGRWEGEIKAKLDSLNASYATMNNYMAEMRGMMQSQSTAFSDLRAAHNSLREDHAEDRERLKRVEDQYVKQKDLEEALRPLKALADRLNNWAWQMALASLGGSALTLTAGYGILRSLGVLQ